MQGSQRFTLKKNFGVKLLDWYRKNCRALPWRLHHADPYQIWISEVMSQQSTLKSVIPYFERWMNRFPTVQKVAAARESSLLSLWQGLGYYSRAKNIHRSAKQLKEYIDKNQQWPEKTEEWLNFPGVGRYTAKAVTSICFGASDVPVDGNVLRVLGRFWAYKDAYNDAQFQRVCEEALMSLSEKTIDIVDRGQFSQSLMELGATVCRPQGEIHCERCPLKSNCLK